MSRILSQKKIRMGFIRIFLWAGRNYGLLQEAGVTSRTSNFRWCSREQYLSCFQAISRRFWGGLRFVLLVGFCTKRRPWPNSLKTANIIVPRFYFRLESCLIYFEADDFEGVFVFGSSVFVLYPPGLCRVTRARANSDGFPWVFKFRLDSPEASVIPIISMK